MQSSIDSNCALNTKQQKRAGYSLTELAVVMAVAAVILGGIWGLANTAFEKARRSQMVDTVTYTVGKIRSFYQSQARIGAGDFAVLTDALIRQDLLPREIVPNWNNTGGALQTALTPWQTAFQISDNTADLGDAQHQAERLSFRMRLNALSYSACTEIVPQLMTSGPKGLISVVLVGLPAGAPVTVLPGAQNNVDTQCSQAVAGTRVDLIYRLRS